MFTAEVASTAGEIVFKRSCSISNQRSKERAFLINQMLEDMRGTIFGKRNSPSLIARSTPG